MAHLTCSSPATLSFKQEPQGNFILTFQTFADILTFEELALILKNIDLGFIIISNFNSLLIFVAICKIGKCFSQFIHVAFKLHLKVLPLV